jgi:hypothetical protein
MWAEKDETLMSQPLRHARVQQRDAPLMAKSGTRARLSSLILVEAHSIPIISGHASLINRAHRPGLAEQHAGGWLGDSLCDQATGTL